MKETIYNFVRSCDPCQRKRGAAANREKLLLVSAGAVFDKVYLDLSGPYHTSGAGNKYICCLIDHFYKYVVASPIPDCTAVSVAHSIMHHFILKHGAMTQLISDNASYLKGELMTELGKLMQIGRYFCTPYHHEGNGVCERVFATFQAMLRTFISENQLDWDKFLDACVFTYNTSVHSSTNETPFFLVFGRDPVFNIDLMIKHSTSHHIPLDNDASLYKECLVSALHSAWQTAVSFNQKQQSLMKTQYDKSHLSPLSVTVGDRVYLRDYAPKPGLSTKLCFPWLGQFRVVAVDPPHLSIISITAPQSTPRRVHMNQVKKVFVPSGPAFTQPWLPAEEEQALSSSKASIAEITGYHHSLLPPPAVAPPPPTVSGHSYNTRFRKRTTSL